MMESTFVILLSLCTPILGFSFSNNTTDVNCQNSDDCSSGKVCVDFKCDDPCLGGCGPNTVCLTVNEVSMCACKPGYIGHPFHECYPKECMVNSDCPEQKECRDQRCEDACKDACGPNSICKGIKHRPICSCISGYFWKPLIGCQIKNCTMNSDCPEEKACINEHCEDPCKDACGLNTICKVIKHRPICSCSPEHVWDPLIGCQEIKECAIDEDCPSNHTCNNGECAETCNAVCGLNTICIIKNNHAACSCKPGFVGNPFLKCVDKSTTELRKKYYIGKEKVAWIAAIEQCRSKDMYLASITSPSEQADIKRACNESGISGLVYVSGSDLGSVGEYVWSSTGKRLLYTNWKSGEPEVSDVYPCVTFSTSDYKWQTRGCTFKRYYVCEYFRS
ncbi:adhesion G protein-coupled receptor E1-like [Homalodisca vitripennis]|uniref:adhesion G protein-coupled receptor E1-like n=1 Tax=Homalodisca vitripennis TaxID=197043 RepID=UPI001EE9EF2B|nr:adhesion G protein-coupled receptor E1-like [Homalodisca vitripennis]